MGWPPEIMQGGPQLPGQLTAINKKTVVRPMPEAAGAAKSGPCRGHSETSRRSRAGRPACSEMWKCGAQSPAASFGAGLPAAFRVLGRREFSVFFTNPSEMLPVRVAAEGSISLTMGKLIRGTFGVHSARPSWLSPRSMTPCSGAAPGMPSTAPPGWWPGRRTLPHQAAYTTTLTRLPKVPSG